MKNESKILTGGLILIVITLLSGLLFSFLLSEQITNIAIDRTEKAHSSFISSSANNQFIIQDFELGNFDEKRNIFDKFFQKLKTEEMLRIKVWSKDGTIIF